MRMLKFGPLEGEAADKPGERYETGFAQTPVLPFAEARCTTSQDVRARGPLRGAPEEWP